MGKNGYKGPNLADFFKIKGFFWPKIVKTIEYEGPKLNNLKKKKHFGQKKLGLSLRRKRKIFWAKNWEKIEYIGQKFTNFLLEKRTFWAKKQAWAEL